MAARRRLVLSIVVFVCGLTFAAVPAHAAAILLVDSNGLLTGATGVNVGRKLYNVEFVDGTCRDLFGFCDAVSDFALHDSVGCRGRGSSLAGSSVHRCPWSGQLRFHAQPHTRMRRPIWLRRTNTL
jgi:hypothetical protein